jgi:hypothetical protein
MNRVAFLGWLVSAGLAGADEVFILGGGHLTGEVVERGPDSIVVDVGYGQVGVSLSAVERIVATPNPGALYQERAARLAPDDVAGWLALGQWAHDQDLVTKARAAYAHVLSLEPVNEAAHRGLGHVRVGDQWTTLDESYRSLGYVRFEGAWVSPEERRAILDEWLAAAEEDRARVEAEARAREAEARVREAEARARAAEAAALRAEAELRRTEADAYGFPYPGFIAGFSPWLAASSYPRFHSSCCGFSRPLVRGFTPFFPQLGPPFGFPPTVRAARLATVHRSVPRVAGARRHR